MDKLQFETVLQLAEEEMPKEVGLPLVVPGALKAMRPGAEALLCPGDKGTLSVNMGQQPFKLQPPASRPRPKRHVSLSGEDKQFRPLAELMELRRQWRAPGSRCFLGYRS